MTDSYEDLLTQTVALCLIPQLGSKTLARLLDHFGSRETLLSASTPDLLAVPRVGPRLAEAIRAVDLARTQADIAAWRAAGITILLRDEILLPTSLYPAALKPLNDAPPVLFWMGQPPPPSAQAVAIVGTRTPTDPASRLVADLARTLAEHGWTVVSGLAAGIDTTAHQGALEAGGHTLAVLGCGVQIVYPPGNAALAARVRQQGALLSEVHPQAAPNSPALVARNRLISGLAQAVIVVEAGATSGSLHAAHFARLQGRVVYTIESSAPGNRQLLATGARPLPPSPTAGERLLADLASPS